MDAKYTARNFAKARITHSEYRCGKWPAPQHNPAPGKIVAECDVRFRAMSAYFAAVLLEFMRAMRLARRKSHRPKDKGRTPYPACGLLLQG